MNIDESKIITRAPDGANPAPTWVELGGSHRASFTPGPLALIVRVDGVDGRLMPVVEISAAGLPLAEGMGAATPPLEEVAAEAAARFEEAARWLRGLRLPVKGREW